MKNKTSILVGTRHFFYALLVSIIFCGCEKEPKSEQMIKQENNWQGFEVIIIDSCEYINKYEGGNIGYRFTHKGNCKFCTERSKK